ncbi:acyl carrier protein [Corynebacterium hadale]|uniref:acyl carrier protein n=1 Tax=Corynebacterium hadale TaxID=2026255 RepID=UPI0013FD13CE|nr:phosphopantetheine-binding protein [Corynebacterium hadale]
MELSQRLNLGDLGKLLDDTPNDTGKDSDGSAFARLAALIERITGEEDSVHRESRLSDVDVSSLDRVELAIRIEDEFGARVTEQIYDEYETVGQLAEFLEEHE